MTRCHSLWHVAPAGVWDGIRHQGFRTAEQLIIAARLDDDEEHRLLTTPRRETVRLDLGEQVVTIRDQGRLFQRRDLTTVLAEGMTVADWVQLLNQRVYLFTRRAARDRLLEKYLQRDGAQDVISFSAPRLYEMVSTRLELTTQNTGSIARRSGPQKDWSTFVPVGQFPSRRTPAEVTVRGGLDSIDAVVEVRRHYRDGRTERIDIQGL